MRTRVPPKTLTAKIERDGMPRRRCHHHWGQPTHTVTIMKLKNVFLFQLSFFVLASSVAAQQPATMLDDYYNIGAIHQEVSTASPAAQKWFDRGLAMCHGFNHEEAVRCFEKALKEDPGFAMAHWGIAFAWGPNMNNMEVLPHQIAKAEFAIQLAQLHAGDASEFEQALIKATAVRYRTPVPEDRQPLNRAYADAMRTLHEQFGDSSLVAALYAESLINLQPWKNWSPTGEPGPHTLEIVRVLESGLERWPDDPALCHLYIHTMEASPDPNKALPAADRLRTAVPGSGHLVHMPTHIDVLVGHYDDVIAANQRAIEVDKEFLEREGPYNFFSLYRIHNYHFLVYGACSMDKASWR